MACEGFISPLDLECIFVNTFAGTMEIFTFIALIFIAAVGASFRMLSVSLLIMFALFAMLMARYLNGLYFLAVLIAGLIGFMAINRIVK